MSETPETIQHTHITDERLIAMLGEVWQYNSGDIEPHEIASLLAEVISSRVHAQAQKWCRKCGAPADDPYTPPTTKPTN